MGFGLTFLAGLAFLAASGPGWRLPVDCHPDSVRLTRIGQFGRLRRARPGIPAHLHTGVDIARPSRNYRNEPIYPVARGRVVSRRDDGPYAQLIIEHGPETGDTIWSVYEHIAGIACGLGDSVVPERPIGRFMNRAELDRHGWQFDHLHLEIMKVPPRPRPDDPRLPHCLFMPYGLICYTRKELEARYLDPLIFIREKQPPCKSAAK